MIKGHRLITFIALTLLTPIGTQAQGPVYPETVLAAKPPMGWMSSTNSRDEVNEIRIREIADAMVNTGMVKAGYEYIVIGDGWQGGRDRHNQILADSLKFPSGISGLAKHLQSKGLKLGITSNAAQVSCGDFNGSLNFEDQDAKTFAEWGVDFLRYEYCGAPVDSATIVSRYRIMSDALRKSGRDIILSISERGISKPWYWARKVGGQLWRTSDEILDTWDIQAGIQASSDEKPGLLNAIDINSPYHPFAGAGRWNDAGKLVVGLNDEKSVAGKGSTEIEQQSQMSIWSMMASPLFTSIEVGQMTPASRQILLNDEIIAINQDALGKQAERVIHSEDWSVWLKPLSNGDFAIAILNRTDNTKTYTITWSTLGLTDQYVIRDVWLHQLIGKGRRWRGKVLSHETRIFRLKKV